jgi:hypothetical protein
MKTLVIVSFALFVGAAASKAMMPGMPEVGRHVRSLPAVDVQPLPGQQEYHVWDFNGDLVVPSNGPLFAPFMPTHPPAVA